jgi:hypothetical protein
VEQKKQIDTETNLQNSSFLLEWNVFLDKIILREYLTPRKRIALSRMISKRHPARNANVDQNDQQTRQLMDAEVRVMNWRVMVLHAFRSLFKIGCPVLLLIVLDALTSLSTMMACSNTIDYPTWTQRCPTGRWCDSEDCAACPGCGTDCFCDCNVVCPCFPGWIYVCSCWFNSCGGGGTAGAPAKPPHDTAVSGKGPRALPRCGDTSLVSRTATKEGREKPCVRCSS